MKRKYTTFPKMFAVILVVMLWGVANPPAIVASPGTNKDSLYLKIQAYNEHMQGWIRFGRQYLVTMDYV